jgi:hypothetical protein
MKLRTKNIHLHLSWDRARTEDGRSILAAESCWVGVKWIDINELKLPDEASQPFDLNQLASSGEEAEHGAAMQSKMLWMKKSQDLLMIKFAFDDPPIEPAATTDFRERGG